MIPFRDDVPSKTTPVTTISLILVNLLVFAYQLTLAPEQLQHFFFLNGVVPGEVQLVFQEPLAVAVVTARTLFTSMFLHGGWLHLIGNLWYLWIFGDNVEDRMGHFRFLIFYLICGLAGGITHIAFNLNSSIPSIGASGAIAGVLGAYLLSYPFARIHTLIPLFFFWPIVELPALVVLGFWFVIQLLQGAAAIGNTEIAEGVAFWAHVGGFVTGMLLLGSFARPLIRRYRWELET